MGTNGYVDFSVTNNAAFSGGITAWSLYVDGNGNVDLSVTAVVPEPEHIMLMCVGVLLAGFAIRRRWQRASSAASVT